jgi:butyryl-CoA dehydrogenase
VLDSKHLEYREKARAFALEHIAPLAAQLDAEQRFPHEHIKPLVDAGMMSMLVPEEYGGQPIDTTCYSIAVEEVSRVCGSTGILLLLQPILSH